MRAAAAALLAEEDAEAAGRQEEEQTQGKAEQADGCQRRAFKPPKAVDGGEMKGRQAAAPKHHGGESAGRIRKLIQGGANVNAFLGTDELRNPLYAAIVNGRPDIVRLLIEKRADVNCISGPNRYTPIQFAVRQRHRDHAPPASERRHRHVQPPEGHGAAHSVRSWPSDCARLLLEWGAEVDALEVKDKSTVHFTPLILCCQGGVTESVRLLQTRADPDREMINVNYSQLLRPLFSACSGGNIECVASP